MDKINTDDSLVLTRPSDGRESVFWYLFVCARVYVSNFDSVLFMSENGFSVGRRPSFCAALACPSMKWPCCLVTGEAAPLRKNLRLGLPP